MGGVLTDVVIVGNGGHARACVDAWDSSSELRPVGYLGPEPTDVLGLPYLGDDDELPRIASNGLTKAFVALGPNELRSTVTDRCLAAGLELVTVVAPTAQVGATARVGPGTVVLHKAVLGANALVGRGSIINTSSSVDHDCVIGDFVHIAPGVNLAGNVVVGDEAMVGIGASVVPWVRIGAGATVGAGAVVLRDVPDGAVFVGVPAQELAR
jgi:sugar O-acyltransferase (sialic acid O-acetyltransferase NeuD family)